MKIKRPSNLDRVAVLTKARRFNIQKHDGVGQGLGCEGLLALQRFIQSWPEAASCDDGPAPFRVH